MAGLDHAIAHEEIISNIEIGVYRASAVGYCEWALLAARRGITGAAPPQQMQKVFDEGHAAEQDIIDMFYDANKYLAQANQTNTVEMWIGNTICVRGHVDDIALHGLIELLIEVKALGKDLWKQWEKAVDSKTWPTGDLWDKYANQVEVYMNALGVEECAFVCGQKDEDGKVIAILWMWVKPDVERLAKIKAKIATVEARCRGGVALPTECDQQVYPCPYYYLMHKEKPKANVIELDDEKLRLALMSFYQAGVDAKRAEDNKKAAKKQIDDIMKAQPVTVKAGEMIAAGEWLATLIERDMPATTRKASKQKFWQVKPKGE